MAITFLDDNAAPSPSKVTFLDEEPAAPSGENYSLSGLAKNAVADVGRNIQGLGQAGVDAAKTMYQLGTGPSPFTSPRAAYQNAMQTPVAQDLQQMPGALKSGAEAFVKDPIGAMYRNPVTTALTAESLGGKALSLADRAAVKGISSALGPSQEAIEARIANPEAIRNASSYADLAQKLPDTLNQLKDQIGQHAEKAYSTLRDSVDPAQGAMPKSALVDMWGDLMKKLQTDDALVGPAKKAASEKLTSIVDDALRVAKDSPNLSEAHVKGILQSIDPNIDWTDKGASASNSILTDLRGRLDQALKQGNPNYASAMQPVADKLGLLQSLQKAFGITNKTGEGLQPTDSTISRIQSLPSERKSISQGLANDLKQATGEDLIQKSKDYGYAKQFQGGAANGARRVMGMGGAGAGIGAYLFGTPGAVAGEALGNVAGLVADKYGGSIAGALVDQYAPLSRGIEQLTSSAPSRIANQAALAALLDKLYQQRAQRPSR